MLSEMMPSRCGRQIQECVEFSAIADHDAGFEHVTAVCAFLLLPLIGGDHRGRITVPVGTPAAEIGKHRTPEHFPIIRFDPLLLFHAQRGARCAPLHVPVKRLHPPYSAGVHNASSAAREASIPPASKKICGVGAFCSIRSPPQPPL